MDMKQFDKICRLEQNKLKKYVSTKLKKSYDEIIVDDGFVYAQGNFPVLLVAHMDTVHKDPVKTIVYDNKGTVSSPQGIGGDDRCGVYMILKIVQEWNCSILFCEDEEIGCIGARKFCDTELAKSLVGKFNYIIEFDRKGKNDAVFYECDNPDFEKFITKEFFKTNYGSLSDISYIAPDLKCAAVNLSCGYYNAHTTKEYVIMSEVDKVIKEAKKILDRTTEEDKFEYIECKYGWYGNVNGKSYSYYDYDGYEAIWCIYYYDNDSITKSYETYATSEAEAIGMFCMDNEDLCYNDIIDIFCY